MANIEYKDFIWFLESSSINQEYMYLKEKTLVFKRIDFTKDLMIESTVLQYASGSKKSITDYLKYLEGDIKPKYDGYTLWFDDCRFDGTLKINDVLGFNYTFENCTFKKVIFENLEVKNDFKYAVNFIFDKKQNEIELFINNSEIDGALKIDGKETSQIKKIIVEKTVFNDEFEINDCHIENIEVEETIFNKLAHISKCTIDQIFVQETEFNNEFKIYESLINIITIEEVKFSDIIFYNVDFSNDEDKDEMTFMSTYVKGFSVFEECKFYGKAVFEYVYFYEFAQFRNSTFYKGLDLDRTNIKSEMNFYGISGLELENKNNDTSQETYRIIKYNFEKIGNVIEANKYHALELDKKRESLKFNDNPYDWIVFNINRITSNFGTDWKSALISMVVVSLITMVFMHCGASNRINDISTFFEKFFSYIYIGDMKIFDGHPIIMFFNKISIGYLYYQFVTAVRKDTRK